MNSVLDLSYSSKQLDQRLPPRQLAYSVLANSLQSRGDGPRPHRGRAKCREVNTPVSPYLALRGRLEE